MATIHGKVILTFASLFVVLASVMSVAANNESLTNQLMKEGDAAFTRGDYLEARNKYKKVVEIEPRRYYAVLFTGNTYFALKQWDDSIVWFKRASDIAPGIETAHRWWGDALMWQRKPIEALSKYIDAIVAEPYNPKTGAAIQRWVGYARSAGISFRISNPVIRIPLSVNNRTVSVDPELGSIKGQEAWFGYSMSLVTEKGGNAFERELRAYKAVLQVARERGYTKETQGLDPSLVTLFILEEKGLLETYIFFTTKNQAVAELYPAYRDKHRDTLRRYWAEEVIKVH